MSKLEQLLQKLCPDGVEYKKLRDVAEYSKKRISASEVTVDTYIGVDNLLQNKQGKTTSEFVPREGNVISYSSGDVLIGNIRPYLKKIWLADCNGGTNGDVLCIHILDTLYVLPRYLFYVLSSDVFFQYDMQHAKGAKMPRGNKEAVMDYLFPLPPLKIQQEIVNILDTFTELTAELIAELTARKKQYEYYRDLLLKKTINTIEGKWLEVGDVVEVISVPFKLQKKDYRKIGRYPIVSQGQKKVIGYTDDKKLCLPKSNYVIFGDHTREIKYINFSFAQGADGLKVLKARSMISARFLYHSLKILHIPNRGYNRHWSIVYKMKIYIPSFPEQQRIVKLLDPFETLTKNISIGIPSEIEARRKQYEYYRDKLLTFTPKKES